MVHNTPYLWDNKPTEYEIIWKKMKTLISYDESRGFHCPICDKCKTIKKDKQKKVIDHFLTKHLSINGNEKVFNAYVDDVLKLINIPASEDLKSEFEKICKEMKDEFGRKDPYSSPSLKINRKSVLSGMKDDISIGELSQKMIESEEFINRIGALIQIESDASAFKIDSCF